MKKSQRGFVVPLLILVTILTLPQLYSQANDGVSNSALWIHSNKIITCVSVENIDEINNNGDLLIFDYSKSAGIQKGKPWTVVEKGKCYEINIISPTKENLNYENSGELYLFTKPSTELRNQLLNYNLHNPSDSILDIYGERNGSCEQNTDSSCITKPYTIDIFESGLGLDRHNLIRYINVSIQDILNSKYNFGDGVTGGTSSYSEEGRSIVSSPEISEVRKIYESLTTGVESVIEKCDQRIRQEIRLNIKKDYWYSDPERTYISRYKDGTDRELNQVKYWQASIKQADYVLENIGCKSDVVSYLNSKKDEISKVDKLGDALRAKFLKNTEIDWFVSLKSDEQKKEIADFLKSPSIGAESVADVSKNISNTNKTELETPTLKEKLDLVSTDNRMKIYWVLPFVGLILIISILFIRKRK